MLIIPGIYLQHGKAVSLYKGHENDQKKVYSKSPLNMAREFVNNGASMIHLIDLDGSANGGPMNLELIEEICSEFNVPVEIGGGIRSIKNIQQLFNRGAARVILGVSARHLIPEALKKYGPARIILGIKARRNMVESDSLPPESDEVIEIAEQAVAQGITQIVYKDMERQGALYHPNYDDVDRLILMLKGIKIFSSGGIVANNDLEILSSIGTAGALLSRSLIEHKISLFKAIERYETDQDRASLAESLPL